MPRPTSVLLVREEHAHYTRVKAVTLGGVVVDAYTTDVDDTKECEKLWNMEQRLHYKGCSINCNLERVGGKNG